MIYQIYGFNIVCDYRIDTLLEYSRDRLNGELPTATVSVVKNLCSDMENGIKVTEDYSAAVFTDNKCCFSLVDGLKIQIVADNIVFAGDRLDSKRIGEELDGPSMIVLSRYHRRAVLHGSAFLYRGNAYLLLAYPGAGKSTLTTAMTKYHKDIKFLADDTICVEENGSAMFCGMQVVNLNDDSVRGLEMKSYVQNKIELNMGIRSDKTVCNVNFYTDKGTYDRIPIGGIIFLGEAITEGLIQIQKLDFLESFCKIVKNVKVKKILTGNLLMQEMNILNQMLRQNVFAIALHIQHDFAQLEKITYELRRFIDGYYYG